ncbi:uncharacterized protein A4U43_C08F5670 [Asparagus officinalis]|nr:uncharacterized protein A4U43_C08F5670 [Asparagus officinalis]
MIKNPISAEKSDASGSTKTPKTNPPLDFNNYMDVLAAVFGGPDMSLENVDILEIAVMRGIHFDPPRWHRPGAERLKEMKGTMEDFWGQNVGAHDTPSSHPPCTPRWHPPFLDVLHAHTIVQMDKALTYKEYL